MSTIKGFALASGRPVAAVSTLEALARGVGPSPFPVCPLLDARKGQIYGAVYRCRPDSAMECTGQERLSDVASFLEDIITPALFVAMRPGVSEQFWQEGEGRVSSPTPAAPFRAANRGRIGYGRFQAVKT
jgi:hypothetical protein